MTNASNSITLYHDHLMESLAQELLDVIIDHIPSPYAHHCSLVARRWRRRGQQRYFSHLVFTREIDVVRWYTNIPQDPDGIPSYAQDVEFQSVRFWRDPTALGRVLKCFSRVKALTISETRIPFSEVQNIVSSGEFGRELTSLFLISPYSTVSTLMSLVLSFPNLRELMIDSLPQSDPSASILPDKTWKRGPLQSLELSWLWRKEIEYIALCGVTSRRIDLSVGDAMIEKIITRSSETMQELVLQDLYSLMASVGTFPPVVPLPPLPVLTSIEVTIHSGSLSARLADLLSCIHSAPALSSITFKYPKATPVGDILASRLWIDVDRWLARLAMHVKTERNLTLVLKPWPEGNSEWEECLPEFRKAGGELNVITGSSNRWN